MHGLLTVSALMIVLVAECICRNEENSRRLSFDSPTFSSQRFAPRGVWQNTQSPRENKPRNITYIDIDSEGVREFNHNFNLGIDEATIQSLKSQEISGEDALGFERTQFDGTKSTVSSLLQGNLDYTAANGGKTVENGRMRLQWYCRNIRGCFYDSAHSESNLLLRDSWGDATPYSRHPRSALKPLTQNKLQVSVASISEDLAMLALVRIRNASQAARLIEYVNKKHSTPAQYNQTLLPILSAENNTLASEIMLQNVENPYVSDGWGNTALHYAAMNGNAPLALAICEKGVTGIDNLSSSGETALLIAASRNDSKICRILLDKGADPSIYNANGMNSLHLAVEYENSEIVKMILSKTNRKVDKKKAGMDNALWLAVLKENLHITKMLVKAGARPYIRYGNGDTCLHLAVMTGNGGVVQIILSANTRGIDTQNSEGNTALSLAVEAGNLILTETLLKAGADPNIANCAGQTSLHLAVRVRSGELLDIILKDNRTLVNTKNKRGMTPLLEAVLIGHVTILEILLISGADVNIPDSRGVSPLHAAVILGDAEIQHVLLNVSTTMPNSQDKEGNTPLHYAVDMKQVDSVLVLLDNGADPKVVNNENRTSLHIAAALGEERILLILLNTTKSVIEIQDSRGQTALHSASALGQTSTVKALLEQGANPNSKDKMGFNALRVTVNAANEEHKFIEIIQCLLSFNSDPYIRDEKGSTALHSATQAGKVEIVSTILNHSKTGINIQNNNESTALNLALSSWQYSSFRILLKNGADPYIKDNQGRTCLHLAAKRGQFEIVLDILTKDKSGMDLQDASGRTALSYAVSYPPAEKKYISQDDPGIPVGVLVEGFFCGMKSLTAMSLTQLRDCTSVASKQMLKSFVEFINRITEDENIVYDFNDLPSKSGELKITFGSYGIWGESNMYTPSEKRMFMIEYLMRYGADYRTSDGEGNTIFHDAVVYNHLNALEYFKNKVMPEDMNVKNKKGETPMHIAIKIRDYEFSKCLLDNGISPYIPDSRGRTALHLAVELHFLDIVELILNSSKVGIDFRDNSGVTALSLSTSRSNRGRERCELLLRNGADPYAADDAGNTALHAAVIETLQQTLYLYGRGFYWDNNHLYSVGFSYFSNVAFSIHEVIINGQKYELNTPEIDGESLVEKILKYNSSGIDLRNNRGYTALFLAALHSSSDVDVLLNLGADPYITEHEGHTALHAAVVSCGNQRTLECDYNALHKMLTMNNSGVDMQDHFGYTALHYAVSTTPGVLCVLLQYGADPNTQENRHGWTPLHTAVKQDDVGFAKVLLWESKADVNVQNDDGQTPLHLAEKEEIVNLLIRKGADILQTDRRGWTAIHYSAFYGKENITSIILSNNLSNINDQSLFGETPLSIATARNNARMVTYLLDRGAVPNLAHDYLKSPLEIAIIENNIPIFHSLYRNVEDLLVYNMFGLNAFHTASWVGNLEVVQIVRERLNGSIDYPDWIGHTPLQYAAMGKHDRLFQYLVAEGANPLVTDRLGHTVLHYAAEGCRGAIIEAIIHRVREMASREVSIDFIQKQNFLGISAIHLAAFNGNWEAFEVLWNECTFLNVSCDKSNQTILFPAALGGNPGIIDFILERSDLSVNERTVTGMSPAMAAAARGNREAFQVLVSKGARIDDASDYGQTMLHFGAMGGDVVIIETILSNTNADIDSRDVEGFTPLMNAVYHDNLGAAELLLNNNADPQIQNIYGDDLKTVAAKEGNAVLKSRVFQESHNPDSLLGLLLARRNASFDEQVLYDCVDKSSLGKYDIYLAAAKGNMTALRRILKSHVGIRSRRFPDLLKEIMNDFGAVIMDIVENDEFPFNDVRVSPLDIALLFHQNFTVVKYIFENLKMNPRSIHYKATSWTPLDYALFTHSKFHSNSSTNVLLYLLDKCKNSLNESTNVFGWTVAHKAAWTGNSHAFRFLKHYGVDLNRADNFGRTPLHYAALNGHSQVVNTILHASNISINNKDKHGFTPLLLSQVYNHREFFRRLSSVSSDMPSIERNSVVQVSDYLKQISNRHDESYLQTTASLVAHKADLDAQDKAFGWTALHWAVVSGDYQCVQLLVHTGAKINLRSWTGETPLFIARKWMRKGTYEYLKANDGVW